MLHNIKKSIQVDVNDLKQPTFNKGNLEQTLEKPYYQTFEESKEMNKMES